MRESRVFAAERAELAAAREFVAQIGALAGLDAAAIQHCELAVDEAMSNIIEHGYRSPGSDQSIEITCITSDEGLTIIIIDSGEAFNPLSNPIPNYLTPLAERTEGGWGIHFIRTLMDKVQYARRDGQNQLTMLKHRALH